MQPTSAREPAVVSTRRFTDCVGVEWVVYSIMPSAIVQGMIVLLPHAERRKGWLLFESAEGERRRLAPFPANWHAVTPFELERWCMRAEPVGTPPRRRTSDPLP